MINSMVKDMNNGLMELFMLEVMLMDKNRVMEFTSGIMVLHMKEVS